MHLRALIRKSRSSSSLLIFNLLLLLQKPKHTMNIFILVALVHQILLNLVWIHPNHLLQFNLLLLTQLLPWKVDLHGFFDFTFVLLLLNLNILRYPQRAVILNLLLYLNRTCNNILQFRLSTQLSTLSLLRRLLLNLPHLLLSDILPHHIGFDSLNTQVMISRQILILNNILRHS